LVYHHKVSFLSSVSLIFSPQTPHPWCIWPSKYQKTLPSPYLNQQILLLYSYPNCTTLYN